MKSDPKLLQALNGLLLEELSAINQYFVHAEMDEQWDYDKLAKNVRTRSITEMKHAEKLIERILFLEGRPEVGRLNAMHVGEDIPAQLGNDLTLELGAIQQYNAAIALATQVGDNDTRDLLTTMLKDETTHVDDLEAKRDQITQMGLGNFLVLQA